MFALKTLYSKMVKNVDFNIFYEMLVLDTNIYWTSWYLQLLPCMLPLYICLNLWLAVAVAALTNLPVTSVHISQLGGPSIWFLHTYLLLSRYTQWRHMWALTLALTLYLTLIFCQKTLHCINHFLNKYNICKKNFPLKNK